MTHTALPQPPTSWVSTVLHTKT